MIASWKWLADFVDLSEVGGPQGLAELMTRRGLEVEAIRPLGLGFEKVLTVKILKRDKHPQADKLSVCQVTLGQGEPLEIVCGAQNMKAGDIVAAAQVGAVLPNGMKIESSKIRGVLSHGMLCSEEELKLKEKSEGILILPPETPLGRPLAEVLGLDDTIFHFNLTPNRGDCLSQWGLAREIAAATGKSLKRREVGELSMKGCPAKTVLAAGELAPQFWGCWIEGVKIGPSPVWMVKQLEAIGARSINNVVDCSNWVLYELGQPTHAYDAERLEAGSKGAPVELAVRMAVSGEKLPLLDGTEITLRGSELVIADSKKPVALAGVMGGGNSEVTEKTTKLFLECAEFNSVTVRKAAFLHQRRTEAAHRFEKGIDPAGQSYALSRLAHLIVETAGGKIVGSTRALSPSRESAKLDQPRTIALSAGFIADLLGAPLSQKEVKSALHSLHCEVSEKGEAWTVSVPSYRLDLSIPVDLAEEVARSVGYDRIPSTVPTLTGEPTPTYGTAQGVAQELMDRAKNSLANQGLNEVLQYAFTSKQWLSQFGFESAIPILNPLSEEQEVLVPSLLPGLVQCAVRNWHHHFGSERLPVRLFEIRPTFTASGPLQSKSETETGADEKWKLALLLAGPRLADGLRNELGEVDFADLKGILEAVFEDLGARGVRMRPLSTDCAVTAARLLHPFQSVEVIAGKDVVGAFGQVHPRIAQKLKLRDRVWMGEVDWNALTKLARPATSPRLFKVWSDFPGIERDFALLVKTGVTGDQLTQVAIKAGKPLAKVAKVFDTYKGHQVAEGMTSVAVRVIFSEEGRSLKEEEAEEASRKILERWKAELDVQLRG